MQDKLSLLIAAVCSVILLLFLTPASAEANNKFGIHIFDEGDLADAAALVNGNGGEWGYVTVVIREDERDRARWQEVLNQMRRLKLIPIVRIATKMQNSHWEIPEEQEAHGWAVFLNSLNWPVKSRYVILFNEPNHAKEWGGTIDPAGYAKILRYYREILKNTSEDFFILPGALDLAAPNGPATMDATTFFRKMHDHDNFIFTLFDGLASHSYPNPAFSGSEFDTGKMSIQGYKWELSFLKDLGMPEDIPVFITETGWLNKNGPLDEKYEYAFQNVWNDPQVMAVTPFLLNYDSPPFADFSWRNPGTKEFVSHYYKIKDVLKTKGVPEQIHAFSFKDHTIARELVSDSEYSFYIEAANTGQSIWAPEDGFELLAEGSLKPENIKVATLPQTEPGNIARIPVRISTSEPRGIHTISFSLLKNGELVGKTKDIHFTLVSPPSADILARFWLDGNSHTATLEMYDDGHLINRFENLTFIDGRASITSIKNIIPNKNYRFILSSRLFLPSERNAVLVVGTTDIDFGRLLPMDFNGDGKFDISDVVAASFHPIGAKIQMLSPQ